MSEIKIFISGDFCPIREAKNIITKISNPKDIFGELYEIINESDISITNLEGPLTDSESPIKKLSLNFKISPDIASLLKDVGFNLITLANNHIYDQGQKGLEDTFETLEKQDINWVGAGETLEKAQKPYYCTVKGHKLAFINFAEIQFSSANKNHGGANIMHLIDNIHQIKIAKEKVDKVIVIIHGGHEHYHYPSPEMLKRYRFLAENGADVIVGHHTHCIGGYEIHKGKPIFYSLGNFLFPPLNKNSSKAWFEGYCVLLKLNEENINFTILPYEQCKNGRTSINLKSNNSHIYHKIEEISKNLKDEELVHSKWIEYVLNKRSYLVGHLGGFNKYSNYLLQKMGLIDYVINRNKLRYIKQFITCQAHRETAIELLNKYLN